MTHGAILLDGKVPGDPGAATAGCREDAMDPRIAIKAAKRSSEEKARRQGDGVNLEIGCRFVIIGLQVI
jgi:hypothetical protein